MNCASDEIFCMLHLVTTVNCAQGCSALQLGSLLTILKEKEKLLRKHIQRAATGGRLSCVFPVFAVR